LHVKGQKSEKIIPRKNDLVKVLIQIVKWPAKSMLCMIFMRIKAVKLFQILRTPDGLIIWLKYKQNQLAKKNPVAQTCAQDFLPI